MSNKAADLCKLLPLHSFYGKHRKAHSQKSAHLKFEGKCISRILSFFIWNAIFFCIDIHISLQSIFYFDAGIQFARSNKFQIPQYEVEHFLNIVFVSFDQGWTWYFEGNGISKREWNLIRQIQKVTTHIKLSI